MEKQCKCDGCDKEIAGEEVTLCRVDYSDEDWETFRFCPECVCKDDSARPI